MEIKQITNFNDLEAFPEDIDHYTLVKDILAALLDKESTEEVYNSINELRKLNKFERKAFSRIFDTVCYKIKKLLLSENIDLAFIVLVLVSEILEESWRYNEVSDWLQMLLPNILLLSTNSQELSQFAMKCLNSCSTNGFYDDVFVTLLNEINEDNDATAQNSYNLLISLIRNSENTYLIEGLNWDPLFDRMVEIYLNTKRCNFVMLVCELLSQKLARGELFNILANVEDVYIASMLNEMFKLNHKDKVELNKLKY
jgi:hypothetical protein